jgi:PBP1b-binding outer membrane lipoprotein LpoB
MNIKALSAVAVAATMLSGCATWSHSSIEESKGTAAIARTAKSPSAVTVTEGDINRPYTVIGDISVTVNKTTVFHPDPTRELVNLELQKEAAAKGADAVIFTRYGNVGISLMSWGSLEGKGRAVAFK